MDAFIEPFNLKLIITQYLLGSQELFVYAFIIALSIIAGRFNFSYRIYGTLLVISSLIFAAMLGQVVIILLLLILGIVTFKTTSTLFT